MAQASKATPATSKPITSHVCESRSRKRTSPIVGRDHSRMRVGARTVAGVEAATGAGETFAARVAGAAAAGCCFGAPLPGSALLAVGDESATEIEPLGAEAAPRSFCAVINCTG